MDGLRTVAVGIEEERRVVIVPVLRPRAGRTIIPETRLRPGQNMSTSVREGETKPMCSLRVTSFPSSALASEKSSHSGKYSSAFVFSIPRVASTSS